MMRAVAISQTVSYFLIQRLYDWGVRRIYGYPGDGINGIMGALGRAEGMIRSVPAPLACWAASPAMI